MYTFYYYYYYYFVLYYCAMFGLQYEGGKLKKIEKKTCKNLA